MSSGALDASIAFAGLLVMCGGSLAAFAFWLGRVGQRVADHAARLADAERQVAADERHRTGLSEALARLETKMELALGHLGERFGELKADLAWLRQEVGGRG